MLQLLCSSQFMSHIPSFLGQQPYFQSNKLNKRFVDRLIIDGTMLHTSFAFVNWSTNDAEESISSFFHSCRYKSPRRTDERFVNKAQGCMDSEYQQKEISIETRKYLRHFLVHTLHVLTHVDSDILTLRPRLSLGI